ncbi:MAG: hypothetical protein JWM16_1000 [Verrucomicrobiales bacterium]|nr:hypothetical protein [Verrucomicrobiales bacterium]
MKSSALFIISADPRTSTRAAEAVRIAAGVAPWQRVRIQVCFRGAAVLALDTQVEQWVDGEVFLRHLPSLALEPRTLWARAESPFMAEIKEPIIPFETLNGPQLAALAAGAQYVLNF